MNTEVYIMKNAHNCHLEESVFVRLLLLIFLQHYFGSFQHPPKQCANCNKYGHITGSKLCRHI